MPNIFTGEIWLRPCQTHLATHGDKFHACAAKPAKGKKNKNGKSKAKGKKGKTGKKKESKEKKEKRLEKERQKLEKEQEREKEKAIKELFNKGKKAAGSLVLCKFHWSKKLVGFTFSPMQTVICKDF